MKELVLIILVLLFQVVSLGQNEPEKNAPPLPTFCPESYEPRSIEDDYNAVDASFARIHGGDWKAFFVIQTQNIESLELNKRLKKILKFIEKRKYPLENFRLVLMKGSREKTYYFSSEGDDFSEIWETKDFKILTKEDILKLPTKPIKNRNSKIKN